MIEKDLDRLTVKPLFFVQNAPRRRRRRRRRRGSPAWFLRSPSFSRLFKINYNGSDAVRPSVRTWSEHVGRKRTAVEENKKTPRQPARLLAESFRTACWASSPELRTRRRVKKDSGRINNGRSSFSFLLCPFPPRRKNVFPQGLRHHQQQELEARRRDDGLLHLLPAIS